MSEKKKRKVHTAEFKAKVGLEALKGVKAINEIGQEYGVHPVLVSQWKKAIQEQAKNLFDSKRDPKPVIEHQQAEDGAGLVEKKARDQPAMMRWSWIEREHATPLVRQCALASVTRSTLCAQNRSAGVDETDLLL